MHKVAEAYPDLRYQLMRYHKVSAERAEMSERVAGETHQMRKREGMEGLQQGQRNKSIPSKDAVEYRTMKGDLRAFYTHFPKGWQGLGCA